MPNPEEKAVYDLTSNDAPLKFSTLSTCQKRVRWGKRKSNNCESCNKVVTPDLQSKAPMINNQFSISANEENTVGEYSTTSTPLVIVKRKRGRPPKKVPKTSNEITSDKDLSDVNNTFNDNQSLLAESFDKQKLQKEDLNIQESTAETNEELELNMCTNEVEAVNVSVTNESEILSPNKVAICSLSEKHFPPNERNFDACGTSCSENDLVINCVKNVSNSEISKNYMKQIILPIRKSTRLRKRKIDPDAIFVEPVKKTVKTSVNNAPLIDISVKKSGKRGRPRKSISANVSNCLQQIDNDNSSTQSSDFSHTVSTSVLTKANRSSTNLLSENEEKESSTSRKCSRKGRPRKCVRYADLNSGIDSPEEGNLEEISTVSNQSGKETLKVENLICSTLNDSENSTNQNSSENNTDSSKIVGEDIDEVVPSYANTQIFNKCRSERTTIVKRTRVRHFAKQCSTKRHKISCVTSFNTRKNNCKVNNKIKYKVSHQKHSAVLDIEKMRLLPKGQTMKKVIKAKSLCKQKKVFNKASVNTAINMDNTHAGNNQFRKTRMAAVKARKMFGQLNKNISKATTG